MLEIFHNENLKKNLFWDKVLRRKEEKGNFHPVSTGFMPSISLPSFTWVISPMHLEVHFPS